MNGTNTDAYHWFYFADKDHAKLWEMDYYPDYKPPLFDVVDAGYDLWVAALRGSEDNLGHTSLDW